MIAYNVILPTDPERAAKVIIHPGPRRRFWQRKRWLPTFAMENLLDLWELEFPHNATLWIVPTEAGSIPGGAYMRIIDFVDGSRLYKVGLDMALSPHELSKALYHELQHCWQSQMFPTGKAFHTIANWAAIEGERSGLGSCYEEDAQRHELRAYGRPLVVRRKEKI